MWTKENRGRYDRSQQRYPSALTAEEWRLVEPLIPPAKRGGGKRRVDKREGRPNEPAVPGGRRRDRSGLQPAISPSSQSPARGRAMVAKRAPAGRSIQ